MTNDTCKIPECARPRKTRGWCKSHYMYWYRTGQAPTAPLKLYDPSRGCVVDGCDNPYAGVGYCAPHLKRVRAHGNPGEAEIKPRTVGDAADYALAHARLRKARGPASRHECVDCDAPARHWAYDHRDPDEKTDHRGYSYSLKPDHYRPMCVKCHKQFDMNRLNGTQFEQFAAN